MKHFQIKSIRNKAILYERKFNKFRECAEQAVQENTILEYADMQHQDLSNAMLDDGQFKGADFSGSNLIGANMSEAVLSGTSFVNTDLYNTCFAFSDLRGARFEDASFGGTNITGGDISHATFSTLSCFSLDFALAASMADCAFANPGGMLTTMSKSPVVIRGVSKNLIVFMDHCVKIGHDMLDYPGGIALLKKQTSGKIVIPAARRMARLNGGDPENISSLAADFIQAAFFSIGG